MDTTQKTLQQLLKIAQKQQKLIEKLAQTMALPPQHLSPVHPNLHAPETVLASLAPTLKSSLRDVMPIVAKGQELLAFFKPGQYSEDKVAQITKVVQHLVATNQLPFAYTVRGAQG